MESLPSTLRVGVAVIPNSNIMNFIVNIVNDFNVLTSDVSVALL